MLVVLHSLSGLVMTKKKGNFKSQTEVYTISMLGNFS